MPSLEPGLVRNALLTHARCDRTLDPTDQRYAPPSLLIFCSRALGQHSRRNAHTPARAVMHTPRCNASAQSGATVCGVKAVALAPNSRAYFLLMVFEGATGQAGRDRVRRCACTPYTCPRARAAAPHARLADPARLRRPPPTVCLPFALASPSPPLPGPWHAAPHLPSTPPALHARSLGPRARWRRVRQLLRR